MDGVAIFKGGYGPGPTPVTGTPGNITAFCAGGVACDSGTALGNVPLTGPSSVTIPTSGINEHNNYTLNIAVPNTGMQGIQMLSDFVCNVTGAGTLISPGHVPCYQTEAYTSLSFQQQLISNESVVGTLTGAGTLVYSQDYLAKLNNVPGATITYWQGISNLTTNNGTVTNGTLVYCEPWIGTAPAGTSYCLQNMDSTQEIYSEGRYIYTTTYSLGEELSPAASSLPAPGRYYWGITHGAASGTVTNLATNTLWAPFFMPGQQAFSHFGIDIITATAGATCNLYIYADYYGTPGAAAVYGPINVSAAVAGIVESTQTAPFYTLNTGRYWMGVNCSSSAVVLQAYTENTPLTGPSTPSGGDTSEMTAGTSLGTNPAITYFANSNVMPQIWIRR